MFIKIGVHKSKKLFILYPNIHTVEVYDGREIPATRQLDAIIIDPLPDLKFLGYMVRNAYKIAGGDDFKLSDGYSYKVESILKAKRSKLYLIVTIFLEDPKQILIDKIVKNGGFHIQSKFGSLNYDCSDEEFGETIIKAFDSMKDKAV